MANKAILTGNVGSDPEIKQLNSGDKVANFSLATSERWKDKQTGERKEKTEWHRIVVFGNLVSVIEQFVHKGSKLYVEGSIHTRSWEQNGEKKYTTEIVLKGFGGKIELMDSLNSVQNTQDSVQSKPDDEEDEIPF